MGTRIKGDNSVYSKDTHTNSIEMGEDAATPTRKPASMGRRVTAQVLYVHTEYTPISRRSSPRRRYSGPTWVMLALCRQFEDGWHQKDGFDAASVDKITKRREEEWGGRDNWTFCERKLSSPSRVPRIETTRGREDETAARQTGIGRKDQKGVEFGVIGHHEH